jgi:hypothetical protein
VCPNQQRHAWQRGNAAKDHLYDSGGRSGTYPGNRDERPRDPGRPNGLCVDFSPDRTRAVSLVVLGGLGLDYCVRGRASSGMDGMAPSLGRRDPQHCDHAAHKRRKH